MIENENESKIDKLKKRLNSRSFSSTTENSRATFSRRDTEGIRRDWSEEENDFINNQSTTFMSGGEKRNFLKIFLLGSIAFFVVALVVTLIILFGGTNIISSDNVDISISGPTTISGGEILSLSVIVANNNNTKLELADLIIEYPEGTRSPNNLSVELPRERFSLGDIKSGSSTNQEIRAIIFGEDGDKKKIKLTIEYRVAGSNAIFFKEKEYEIQISSSPINFFIESLTDVNSGKEISLDVTLKSNSKNLIEDVLFIAEYPFGFLFKESIPKTSFDQNIWKIGGLSPGEERKLKITGILEGQDGEERVFRFFGGVGSGENERELETAFISSTKSIFIKKPFLAADIVIDGNTEGNYSTAVGKTVQVEILWQNNLSTSVANVEIEAVLSGDFDESSFSVDRGFYNSITDTVIWNQERNPIFESISPGESGSVSFRFKSPNFGGNALSNPEAIIDVNVRGRRLSEDSVSEEVISSVKREVRFDTNLSLVPRATYFSGPLNNTGPIPPKAETETTYTVIWTISNTVNDVSNVKVSATLPSYVNWKNQTDVDAGGISYNPVNREVSWDAGKINSSSNLSPSSLEAVFQVGLIPSLSQVGQTPIILGKTKIVGKDDFTGSLIESTKGELTTRIITDSGYKSGDDKVSE